MAKGTDLLKVSALARRYAGGNGISSVSLSVPAGSVTGFIGVNGAGKSTTLRCVMGLLKPDAGAVQLFGAPASRLSRARIGFLPEERGLFAHERARDAIAFHGRLKGMSRKNALGSADRLLERIGLGSRTHDHHRPHRNRGTTLAAAAHPWCLPPRAPSSARGQTDNAGTPLPSPTKVTKRAGRSDCRAITVWPVAVASLPSHLEGWPAVPLAVLRDLELGELTGGGYSVPVDVLRRIVQEY